MQISQKDRLAEGSAVDFARLSPFGRDSVHHGAVLPAAGLPGSRLPANPVIVVVGWAALLEPGARSMALDMFQRRN